MATVIKSALIPAATPPAWEPDVTPRARTPWLFFGLVLGGVVFAAFGGAALAWDGSYIFFKTVDAQAFFVVHDRWMVAPLQVPALLGSKLSQNIEILRFLFNVGFCLVPLATLAVGWLMVRKIQPGLFLWSALAIGLVTLPGQFFFVSEAIITVQAGWILWLAALTGLKGWRFGVATVVALILFLSHPIVLAVYGLAAVLAFGYGWRYPQSRKRVWTWALGITILTGIAFARFVIGQDPYESEQLSVETLQKHWTFGVAGAPFLAVLCTWITASIAFVRMRLTGANWLRWLELALLGAAGVILTAWAIDARSWDRTLDYRLWAFFLMLPLIGLAAADSFFPPKVGNLAGRLPLLQLAGMVFLLVLAVQTTSWVGLSNRMDEATNNSPNTCIPVTSLPWAAQTPLGHWSVTAFSLVRQGRNPVKVVLQEKECQPAANPDGIPITPWDWRKWDTTNWFNLGKVRENFGR
jgi:hypothetical protein